MKLATYDVFESIELRSGTIIKTQPFDRAIKSSFKIWADFGEQFGVLQTSAQVTDNYTLESLIGKKIIGCLNLGEKNIAGFKSQFLLIGFSDEKGAICLALSDGEVANGQKLI